MSQQILVNVNEDGEVEVYYHDPEMSGRVAPAISIVYHEDRKLRDEDVEKYIEDFDNLLECQDTSQIF